MKLDIEMLINVIMIAALAVWVNVTLTLIVKTAALMMRALN
jgi:hypothetical protein